MKKPSIFQANLISLSSLILVLHILFDLKNYMSILIANLVISTSSILLLAIIIRLIDGDPA